MREIDPRIDLSRDAQYEALGIRNDSVPMEKRAELFSEIIMTTKEDVLANLEDDIAEAKRYEKNDRSGHYKAIRKHLEGFYGAVEKTPMMTELEPWWFYEYCTDSYGSRLFLSYQDENFRRIRHIFIDTPKASASYLVVDFPSKSLTIEEYASNIGKNEAAIRQSLRRGKFRTAFKVGHEWRIPELATPPSRGYKGAEYIINEDLTDIPPEFAYLKAPSRVKTSYEPENKRFKLYTWFGNDESTEIELSQVQMERLETFLISSPYVKYEDNNIKMHSLKKNRYDDEGNPTHGGELPFHYIEWATENKFFKREIK